MDLNKIEFVAFDLETTGLSPVFGRIVEIGAIRFNLEGTELARMQQLVNPECSIPARVTQIHGITDEMVLNEPPVDRVLNQFFKFIDSPNTVLVAHNASFDVSFLCNAVSRINIDIPDHMVVDNLELAREILHDVFNYRLETLAQFYNIVETTEHRALSDSIVLQSVFLQLLQEEPAIETLDNLLGYAEPYYIEPVDLKPISVPEEWKPLLAAIEGGQSITICYEGGTSSGSKRQVTPINIIETNDYLYVKALCHIDDIEKHFRLDRIREVWWE